jgi:hypothetical protein
VEGVLRRIRWVGLFVGVAAMIPLALGLTRFVSSVIDPPLYRTYIAEGAGVTAREGPYSAPLAVPPGWEPC